MTTPAARALVFAGCAWLLASAAPVPTGAAAGRQVVDPPASNPASSPAGATLDRYCATCHNDRLRTGGLTLAALDPSNPSGHAEIWERVVRKLRTREMPPPGAARPDEPTYAATVETLERALDATAAAHPQPGRVAVHRLSRTEYANAVRDLLAIELPAPALLPADEPDQQTFDNVASVLSVSPALLENYLSAAYRVSRLAVADPAAPPAVDTYTVPLALTQDERVSDDLPFGSQGGLAVPPSVPGDRRVHDYRDAAPAALSLHHRHGRAAPDRRPPRRRAAEAVHDWRRRPGHDGARKLCRQHAGRSAVGGLHAHRGRRPAGARPGHGGCPRGERVVRAPLLGGRRHPAAAAARLRAHDERAVSRQPCGRYRGRRRARSCRAAPTAETSSSRQRLFVCQPSSPDGEAACARRILERVATRAYRRPGHHRGARHADAVLCRGARARAASMPASSAASNACWRRRPFSSASCASRRGRRRASIFPLSDLDLASRLSFFLWSSVPDDALRTDAARGRLREPGGAAGTRPPDAPGRPCRALW